VKELAQVLLKLVLTWVTTPAMRSSLACVVVAVVPEDTAVPVPVDEPV
jgi:hypothetical protein